MPESRGGGAMPRPGGAEPHPHTKQEPHPHTKQEPHPHTKQEPHPHTGQEPHPHTGQEPHPHTGQEPHLHTRQESPRQTCSHCSLPVPVALYDDGAEHQFCCAGCRTVFEVIHGGGLDRYYAVRRELADGAAQPAKTTGRSYAEFDDEAFERLYCRDLQDGLRGTDLFLEGVHCAACVWLVERAPRLVPGAVEVRLDVGKARARVVWDPQRARLSDVARALDSLGYPAHPFRGQAADEAVRKQERAMLIRIGIAGACAGNAMAIGFAIYGGILHGMEQGYADFFRWMSLVVTLPALVWGGSVFFRGAVAALRTRTLHMDVPVALGIAIAFAGGAWNTVRGTGPVYFDGVTGLIFLLLAGRFIQVRQQRTAADSAELLHALAPSSARLIEPSGAAGTAGTAGGGATESPDTSVREVPVEALTPGARVEVRAGDTVPADGVVRRGTSTLDTSLLTGEARPVTVHEGDRVHAGTTNLSARLEVEIESAGENTRVGRLMRLVEEYAQRRAPIVQLADRLSGWFVGAVLVLAAATAVLWGVLDPTRAVDNVVALLVVTCPCALGLATPLAVSAAIGQAARDGLLIKGTDVLERLATPGRLWLDKTGTLTEGRLALVRWRGSDEALALATALETHSAHPVARAFVSGAAAVGPGLPPTRDDEESVGPGLRHTRDDEESVGAGLRPARDDEESVGAGLRPARDDEESVGAGLRPARDDEESVGPGLPPTRDDEESVGAGLRPARDDGKSVGPGLPPTRDDEESVGPGLRPARPAPGAGTPVVGAATETLGGGIVGTVNGRAVSVGSPRFITETAGATLAPDHAAEVERLLSTGETPVLVALDGEVAGVAAFADPLRADARASLDALRAAGWRVGILSGDHPRVVAAVAARLGIEAAEARGGLSPEDKLRTVVADAAQRTTVMAGDGVNDAAALSAASVGVGVHGGAEASLAAADVFSGRPGLAPLVALSEGARRTMRVIRRNLVLSLVYNAAGVVLAMSGLIDPLIAAIMMPASSLTVILSSYRARLFPRSAAR